MRILYFHQHFSTPNGAAGIRSYQMARELVSQKHQVTMVCGSYGVGKTGLSGAFTHGWRTGFVDGIEVIEFDLSYSNADNFAKRFWTFMKFAFGSVGIALCENYDLVFATSTPLTVGIPGIAARWLRRKPFVFEVRDLWPELPREMGVIKNPLFLWLMSALEWSSYHSANRCIGLSAGIVDGILRRGINLKNVALIPNGSDIDIFGAGSSAPWRPEGVGDDHLMAIFTGTHGKANGLDAILDAAAELKQRNIDSIRIVLVGTGGEKAALQSRAHREMLGNVIFFEPVDKAKLAGLMAAADLGIQCLANVPAFYFGTSPNKFFDYIAAGLPVLNNYPGWLAQLITENDCGFAVEPDNPVAIADSLCAAAADRGRLKQMGRNSLELARGNFDRTKLARQWVRWVVKGEK